MSDKRPRPSGLRYKKENVFMNNAALLYPIWVKHGKPKQYAFASILHTKYDYPRATNLSALLQRFKDIEAAITQ
ncbi:hypothetical protein [Vibrio vulnificus]|uniref:hypothetical protein n=1 Tax=Vibrio vulnificus TaxID=672 RepID=UPI003241C277